MLKSKAFLVSLLEAGGRAMKLGTGPPVPPVPPVPTGPTGPPEEFRRWFEQMYSEKDKEALKTLDSRVKLLPTILQVQEHIDDDRMAWGVPFITGVAGEAALFVSGDQPKFVPAPFTFRSCRHDDVIRSVAKKTRQSVGSVRETLDRVILKRNQLSHCKDISELMERVEICRQVLSRSHKIKSQLKDQIFMLDNLEEFLAARVGMGMDRSLLHEEPRTKRHHGKRSSPRSYRARVS